MHSTLPTTNRYAHSHAISSSLGPSISWFWKLRVSCASPCAQAVGLSVSSPHAWRQPLHVLGLHLCRAPQCHPPRTPSPGIDPRSLCARPLQRGHGQRWRRHCCAAGPSEHASHPPPCHHLHCRPHYWSGHEHSSAHGRGGCCRSPWRLQRGGCGGRVTTATCGFASSRTPAGMRGQAASPPACTQPAGAPPRSAPSLPPS